MLWIFKNLFPLKRLKFSGPISCHSSSNISSGHIGCRLATWIRSDDVVILFDNELAQTGQILKRSLMIGRSNFTISIQEIESF